MRPAQPLPTSLWKRAFSLAELRRLGVSPERVRRADVVPLGSGIYAAASLVESVDDMGLHRLRALAVYREYPHGWLSHSSAARLMDCPLPSRLSRETVVHLSVVRGQPRSRRSGVRTHLVSDDLGCAAAHPELPEVRLSSPERLYLELAASCSVTELVVVGDWLVRHPRYRLERRDEAYSSIERIQNLVATTGKVPGKSTALEALNWVRVGADSPKETAVRLALIRAGLPEPELQVRLDVLGPVIRYADAAYPEHRIALQYDGAGHFTPQQARADQRRDNEFAAAGWLVIRLNLSDDRESYATAVHQVRQALLARGWTGQQLMRRIAVF
ncbi:hypothetical protein [Nesterenkonia alkaliphila]|uniref:DUF559 domain-containing protein n=1 Tax=Nesterenkonia alkaliphila TaxID=1463631 RepID=A0A7K1UJE5_9MICC|nr:hypothetical protein [Nesterenkonia alkaliphila]MVT26597.1 hypothetical protein [Nesterenkonia alkaliphila]